MVKNNSGGIKDGVDSGAVSDKVKRQVLSNGLGICAAPECLERIDVQRTRLGECAHIIPRRVGSHPREDYSTPLDDRKIESNLIYLCEKHHKIVDNKEHASIYTAEILRNWKHDHEQWSSAIQKDSSYIPKESKDHLDKLFKNFQQEIAQAGDASSSIINKLIDSCGELLDRHRDNEAIVLLSQIDLLLLDSENTRLSCKAKILNARLLIYLEKIIKAKDLLIKIINEFPTETEPMLIYIEICERTPESDDKSESIESIVRELDINNPRLQLLDYSRMYNKEIIPEIDICSIKLKDVMLECRYICQQLLFCDLEGDIKKRDELLLLWEKKLPFSPRPNFFRIIFKVNDFFKSQPDESTLNSVCEFIFNEKNIIEKKDPLHLRDRLSLNIHELRVNMVFPQLIGVEKDITILRKEMVGFITKCYFDKVVDGNLKIILTQIRLECQQLETVIDNINKSNVVPSREVVELVFIQSLMFKELNNKVLKFVNKYNHVDLRNLLDNIEKDKPDEVAVILNNLNNPYLSLMTLQFINNDVLSLTLTKLLDVSEEFKGELVFENIKALINNGFEKDALEVISSISLKNTSPHALQTIESVSYRNKRWDIFINAANEIFKFNIPELYSSQLKSRLASVYHEVGDDTNAINYAESVLNDYEGLNDETAAYMLHVLGQSYMLIGEPDKACNKFSEYHWVKRPLALSLEEASLYLKSSFPDKCKSSLDVIVRALKLESFYDDKLFLSCFMLLLDIENIQHDSLKGKELIEDGAYIKLEGFQNGWFYIGNEEEGLGATCIKPDTENYSAVIDKTPSDSIDWPADKYSGNNIQHSILHIVDVQAYISIRAHEAMQNTAKIGGTSIWSINVINDDGQFDVENFNKFNKEMSRGHQEFFEKYKSSSLPFSFLCEMEGSLPKAIGRIRSNDSGFIFCNDSTKEDIEKQAGWSKEAVDKTPCVIDGLSALMLIEAGLLEIVESCVYQLIVPVSVIRLIRNIASDFDYKIGSVAKAGFVNGEFKLIPIDEQKENLFREKLLRSASFLDLVPKKEIGKTYDKNTPRKTIEDVIPDYFLDSYSISKDVGASILTDDALFVKALDLVNKETGTKTFSSLSLVRFLVDNKKITWEKYLEYFSLLSSYRYHLLQVTVEDMLRSVFCLSSGGIVEFVPQNLYYLNLKLTMSEKYGVNNDVVVNMLSNFFWSIISDSSVPSDVAEEVFKITLHECLEERDIRLIVSAVHQICEENVSGEWSTRLDKEKLKILGKQMSVYIQKYSSIILI